MQTKQRYTLLDILRALAIIAMVAYHTLWDLVYIFDCNIPWFHSNTAHIMQLCIRWSFILISGFCFSFSKRKIRRGLIVLGGAVVIYIATAVFMSDNAIIHGVLTLIGLSMLITAVLEKPFSKIPPVLGALVCFLLFLITYDVELHILGFGDFRILRLPDFLYANNITAIFGFVPAAFYSPDYVPLFPWVFLYFIGYFLCRIFEKRQWLKYLTKIKCPPLEWLGRHSLIIYMAHQPIVYGILYLIFA